MITNAAVIRNMGLPIGNVPTQRIDGAIFEAEMTCIKPAIGDANYMELYDMGGNWMNGGVVTDTDSQSRYIAGFTNAISYIAFAYLLNQTAVATVFGAVRKTDEHSENVDPWEEAKRYFTHGWEMLRECCDAKGWELNRVNNYFMRRP